MRLIISRTDLITDAALVAGVDESLAARIGNWHGWSRQRIANAVDAAVRAIDPDAARARRDAAEDDRQIGISARENGMAEIYGTVEATAATIFDRRLSELAKQVRGRPADAGSASRRRVGRADAGPQPGVPLRTTRLPCRGRRLRTRAGRRAGGDQRGRQ